MKRYSLIIAVILLVLTNLYSVAQNISVSARFDSTSILIGEQVHLTLEASVPKEVQVSWPELPDTLLPKLLIVEKTKRDTVVAADQKSMKIRQVLTVTSFDSGNYQVPPFNFLFKSSQDTGVSNAQTDPLFLQVNTVAVDTTHAFKPIKGPISLPFSFMEALPWIILGLGVVAIILIVIWYLRKRRKAEPLFAPRAKPKLPPHERALEALENLRRAKVWQSGRVKDYYTQLTEILRIYMEERFSVMAMEMTSDEILESLQQKGILGLPKSRMNQVLLLSDLVKFAKEQPLPTDHDTAMSNAVEFVRETMPQPLNEQPMIKENRENE